MAKITPRIRRRVEKLREAVNTTAHHQGSTSFGQVFDLFMELAEDKDFQGLGDVDDLETMLPSLKALATAIVKRPPAVLAILAAVYIPELGLRHGAVSFNGQPGGYFAFDGDHRGMFGFQRADGQFQMMRFTITPLAPDERPDVLAPLVPGEH